jgi:hypothetical protein
MVTAVKYVTAVNIQNSKQPYHSIIVVEKILFNNLSIYYNFYNKFAVILKDARALLATVGSPTKTELVGRKKSMLSC